MNPDIEPILATARDLYGRVVYTHETHERERIICSAKVSTTNRRNTILATATTYWLLSPPPCPARLF